MTLGKRAFTLIFPVVLTGYVLAAVLLYMSQSASILGLERARLWQQLGLLGAVFQNDVTQNKSLIYSLVEGSAVRLFINEPDASLHQLDQPMEREPERVAAQVKAWMAED